MKRMALLFLLSLLTACAATPRVYLATENLTMELKQSAYRNTAVAVSPDGKHAAAGNNNGDIILWDIQSGRVVWKQNAHKKSGAGTMDDWVMSLTFTPDGRKLLSGGAGNKLVKTHDVETGKEIQALAGHEGSWMAGTAAIMGIVVSGDGATAASAGGDGTVRLWDIKNGKLRTTYNEGVRSFFERNMGMTLSVDMTRDGKYTLAEGKPGTLQIWDNMTGKGIVNMPAHTRSGESITAVVLTKDGKRAFSGTNFGELKMWDITTGQLLRDIPAAPVASLNLSPDGKYLLSAETRPPTFKVREVDSGHLIKTFPGVHGGWRNWGTQDAAVFHPDGRHYISKSSDASVRMRDLDAGRDETLLVSFTDGEWVVITSEGYYNASEKGSEYLGIAVGQNSYDMNLFYDVFYRPDIVAAKLRGEDVKGLITITMQDAIKSPPPVVKMSTIADETTRPKVKVCYTVTNAGGGIGEVRLFHNGKLIQSDGYYRDVAKSSTGKQQILAMNSKAIYEDMRGISIKGGPGFAPVATKSKGDVVEECREIEAMSGENAVSVTAFNSGNTVQSALATASFTSKVPPAEPHLYILAIGIDQYKDKSINLKYAVKDASDIEQKLLKQAATVYKPQNIHYELYTDARASKGNILFKINELSRVIKPGDGFILFVAGHGVLLQNQYYMLSSDFDGTVSDSSMISSNEIVEMSKKIRSLSQLFIFDTCHAGGVDAIVSGLYDARMSVLAKKMGLHIYASANSLQEAKDGYEGNGLFTYTLLDGLSNKREADRNKDNAVSLMELGEYSRQATAEISRKIGHSQTPLIINFGKDSPVYQLK